MPGAILSTLHVLAAQIFVEIPREILLLFCPFYRWGSWGIEHLHNLEKSKCWNNMNNFISLSRFMYVHIFHQFSSVAQSCPILCNPMNLSTPGFPVPHQLLEFTQTHIHRVSDAIQPSHPLSSPSPPAPNPSQNQGLFQWVSSSHEVAKVLEFQLQHQSLQWIFRTDLC